MSEHNKELCLKLLHSESEDEVIAHLKAAGYWDNDFAWQNYGGRQNNWSIIGAQQASPVGALVEKLVNSVDAVLMRECQLRNIPLEGTEPPQSISDALELFFGIKKGNLANIGSTKRGELSRQIGLIASGAKPVTKRDNPNYIVFDRGEGQTPRDLPSTILSLSETNKMGIPFVQGKFNMGGSGVLRHGGKNRLQVIISRRCPEIADYTDPTAHRWGFTVVRRQDPPLGMRHSIFTYLAPENEILTFESQAITLPHDSASPERAPSLKWGTVMKLLEYKMKGLRTTIKRDLYYAVSVKLLKPGLPIRFYEFRNYSQDSPEIIMAGLLVRLLDENQGALEKELPPPYDVRVDGEPLTIEIYAFSGTIFDDKKYRLSDGVLFVVNGQVHGALHKRFFQRKKVNKGYLKDSLLVVVDASAISRRASEELFMNNREHLSESEFREKIEERLESIVRDDIVLKSLQERRRREALADKLSDSKPVRDVLEQLLSRSPTLFDILVAGRELSNPYKSVAAHIDPHEFKGKVYPHFFQLQDKHRKRNERPVNRKRIRFQFDTDAMNDYLRRDHSPGKLDVTCNGQLVIDRDMFFLDGIATLNITLADSIQVNDELHFIVEVTDESRIEPFRNEFVVIITPAVSQSKGGGGNRQKNKNKGKGDHSSPSGITIPDPTPVYESGWETHNFNRESALRVYSHGSSYDYFVNMDNVYLKHELKLLKPNESSEVLKKQFSSALVLLGMMILKESPRDLENNGDPLDAVQTITSTLAPAILPMINSLSNLPLDD